LRIEHLTYHLKLVSVPVMNPFNTFYYLIFQNIASMLFNFISMLKILMIYLIFDVIFKIYACYGTGI
ncbi:MAG: hypothetical protein EAZ76_06890, partial [Nostocales cyanobacterium]